MFGHKVATDFATPLPAPPRVVLPLQGTDRECPCGHRTDSHDKIAGRYCAATKASALSRGCVCDTNPKVTAR